LIGDHDFECPICEKKLKKQNKNEKVYFIDTPTPVPEKGPK
jgi:hypothetical protein